MDFGFLGCTYTSVLHSASIAGSGFDAVICLRVFTPWREN